MTDLASLVVKVDATDADDASRSLDKLTESGKRTNVTIDQAERYIRKASIQIDKMGDEAAQTAGQVRTASQAAAEMARDAQAMAARTTAAGNSGKLAGHHMQNLAFQLQDVVIGLQGGQKPMTVFMQQGSQIAMIASQAGVGIGGMASAVGSMALNFAKAHPLLLVVAAAVGVLTAGFGVLAAEINKTSKVQVTWQDTALATFQVVSEAIDSTVTSAFKAMGINIGLVWDATVKATKMAINLIIATVVAVPKLIADTYRLIPAAFGDAFYSAANLAIKALNTLVKSAAAPLNAMIAAVNAAFGTDLKAVVLEGVGSVENPYAGAMGRLASVGVKSYNDTFKTDFVGSIASAISDKAVANAMARASKGAGGKAGSAGGKEAGKKMAEETAKTYAELLAEEMAKYEGQIRAAIVDLQDYRIPLDVLADVDGALGKESERLLAEWERQAQEDRQRALDTAYDIADIIGGSVGQVIGRLADILETSFPKALEGIGEALKGIGLDTGKLAGFANLGGIAGGGAGGSIGGIAGGMIGEKLLGKLGDFAGPIGSIVGGILGGVIGGMVKSTPRASATVSIIAGEAMETAVKGSSGKLKAIAGGMADSLIGGLQGIADALGAQLTGDASVSVGMRNGKYRVDTTGSGITKTSKGAVDFGEDQAAAIAFALQDAIKDGVLSGLSDSIETLLKGDGDLQANLEKALAFKGVFDELLERTDPVASALEKVGMEHTRLKRIFDEAGASAEEYAKLEELFALKRAEATAQTADATDVQELANQRRRMEIQLLEAQGLASDALAASRALELEQMDASLRPLQEQINAALDAAEAQRRLADEQATAAAEAERIAVETARQAEELARVAAAIAQERYGLETRLLTLQGDTNALRERELATLDPANRALLAQIFAIEDLKVAADAAAQATANLAAETARIADERYGLETQLLELLGDVNALRERERAKIAEGNLDLFDRINALKDEQAATKLAEQAAADLARAQEDAAREALRVQEDLAREALRLQEELAAIQKAIADERYGLETKLLTLIGDTAALRERELATLDPSNRALQLHIWAIEDKQAADERATEAVRNATQAAIEQRNTMIGLYQTEAEALAAFSGRFADLAADIKTFRTEIFGSSATTAQDFAQVSKQFDAVARGGRFGNEASLASFVDVSRAYLDSARANAGNLTEYRLAQAKVANAADNAVRSAFDLSSEADSQVAILQEQIAKLEALNVNAQATLERLDVGNDTQANEIAPALDSLVELTTAANDRANVTQADTKAQMEALVFAVNELARIFRRADRGDSIAVTNDSDTPLTTVTA